MNNNETKQYVDYTPAADIVDNENGIKLYLDMPGANKSNTKIDIADHTLTVTADTGLLYNGKSLRYQRAFSISNEIDTGKIAATARDGVLMLELPKAESAKAFSVKVAG
ncbi:MAG: Hsp20/alpha crystallin family protein [Victivallaceae bacterium]|nr:Hsp20/alpha crystallin family protein [Victivallaceae bacterium]